MANSMRSRRPKTDMPAKLRDDKYRASARTERSRNVVVDAGAGTGKTKLIVDRFINLLAPEGKDSPVPIERLAAVTFSRRAGGELRYRIGEKILSLLGDPAFPEQRKKLLHEALNGIDSAFIGTIHSFADRLLRLRPVEARLSPSYEIVETPAELYDLTFERLIRAVEEGNLAAAAELAPKQAAEIEQYVRDYLAAGWRLKTEYGEHASKIGLDALVTGMISSRDVQPAKRNPDTPDFAGLAKKAKAAAKTMAGLEGKNKGCDALRRTAADFERLAATQDPCEFLRNAIKLNRLFPGDLQKRVDFENNEDGWKLKKHLMDVVLPEILKPLNAWMAARLTRLFPAVVNLYEKVKSEQEVVDLLDLLLKLHNVLEKPEHRSFYAGLFDHIFVDEFQDTDPVQAHVLKFLIQADSGKRSRPGTITIVGDPKQSIYRFRRADIAAYDEFRRWLIDGGALCCSLTTNFRSSAAVIDFVNAQFEKNELMGEVVDGKVFDPESGAVFYEPMAAFHPAHGPAIHLIPISGPIPEPGAKEKDLSAEIGRTIQADALARYLRHLMSDGAQVREDGGDPDHPIFRSMRWGDVAVLGLTTTSWPILFDAFDRFGIPYSARGGGIFGRDRTVQTFILGLRAVSDPNDGIAMAAYFRMPFWPITLEDVLGETPAQTDAKTLLDHLRRDRLTRPPAYTARDLLEKSRLAAAVNGGPNGPQTLEKLRELVHMIDAESRSGRSFDDITFRLRSWLDHSPEGAEEPDPIDRDVVRVTTIYQAKGLEFPVVVVADSFQKNSKKEKKAWHVQPDGSASVSLEDLKADIPVGAGVLERETAYRDAELRRLAYVAVTRAKDHLVIVKPPGKNADNYLYSPLMTEVQDAVMTVKPYQPDNMPKWAKKVSEVPDFRAADAIVPKWEKVWRKGLDKSARPVCSPVSVTKIAREVFDDESAYVEHLRRAKAEGRHGMTFGLTVHRSLQLILSGASGGPGDIVNRCAAVYGLTEHIDEAVADVGRALAALKNISGKKYPEYPFAVPQSGGELMLGIADLICAGDETWVIDFKTDTPPSAAVQIAMPQYAAQLSLYVQSLQKSGVFGPKKFRAGLLFTASGRLEELAT